MTSLLSKTAEDPANLSDEKILKRSEKHPNLFGLIVDRYEDSFRRTSFRVLRDQEEVEDAVQEAFIKIYKNASKFEPMPGASFKSWAFRILMNVSINRYNKRKRDRSRFVSVDSEVFENSLAREDANMYNRLGARYLTEELMKKIPEAFQSVIDKYYIKEKSQQEIAEEEGSTVASIKMRLFRARKIFQKVAREKEEKTKLWMNLSKETTVN